MVVDRGDDGGLWCIGAGGSGPWWWVRE